MPHTPKRPDDPRRKVWNSHAWRKIRLHAIARDGGCLGTGPHGGPLSVHHIVPIGDDPTLAFDLSNLTTRCVRCHGRMEGGKGARPRAKVEHVNRFTSTLRTRS